MKLIITAESIKGLDRIDMSIAKRYDYRTPARSVFLPTIFGIVAITTIAANIRAEIDFATSVLVTIVIVMVCSALVFANAWSLRNAAILVYEDRIVEVNAFGTERTGWYRDIVKIRGAQGPHSVQYSKCLIDFRDGWCLTVLGTLSDFEGFTVEVQARSGVHGVS